MEEEVTDDRPMNASNTDATPLRSLVPLPPTAATLLTCDETDARGILTVLTSDVVVARAVQV
ncbi:MAG: hypothetical protein C4320_07895, partial [Armatimonadota bacterium]